MAAEPSGISTYLYQTPVQYWCKWILYKLTLVPQSGWPLVCGFVERISVGARQLVRGHRPAGAVPSGTRGRHTPVLAHQLASARKILSCASCISWFDRRVFRGRFPVFRGSIVVYFVVNSLYFVVRSSCISWSIPCTSWFDRRVFRGQFPVFRGSIVVSFVVDSLMPFLRGFGSGGRLASCGVRGNRQRR